MKDPLQDLNSRCKKAITKMEKILKELKTIEAAYGCAADAWSRERELYHSRIQLLSVGTDPGSGYMSRETFLLWFTPDEFLQICEKHINIYTDKSTYAVAMRDGNVYFTPKLLCECLKELILIKSMPEDLLNQQDRELYKYVGYITTKMREIGALAENLICPKHRWEKFKVIWNKKEGSIFYTPFKSAAFDISIIELEKRKERVMKKFEAITAESHDPY